MSLVSSNAAAVPTITPSSSSLAPWPTINASTSVRAGPNAMQIPISRVFRETLRQNPVDTNRCQQQSHPRQSSQKHRRESLRRNRV